MNLSWWDFSLFGNQAGKKRKKNFFSPREKHEINKTPIVDTHNGSLLLGISSWPVAGLDIFWNLNNLQGWHQGLVFIDEETKLQKNYWSEDTQSWMPRSDLHTWTLNTPTPTIYCSLSERPQVHCEIQHLCHRRRTWAEVQGPSKLDALGVRRNKSRQTVSFFSAECYMLWGQERWQESTGGFSSLVLL